MNKKVSLLLFPAGTPWVPFIWEGAYWASYRNNVLKHVSDRIHSTRYHQVILIPAAPTPAPHPNLIADNTAKSHWAMLIPVVPAPA